ncbi:DUF4256 domain-containing protein, partial [bacterium]|nr:DUF4256 domain-containing protein [bacterium]
MTKASASKGKISLEAQNKLLQLLKSRFLANMNRHKGIDWAIVEARIVNNPLKAWSLYEMEMSGGEPDVVGSRSTGEVIFYDCSAESPAGRRSLCFDKQALDSRKENKPKSSAVEAAERMGIELLTEEEYRELQSMGTFDAKTSSWVKTPKSIRDLGGAIFCDFRFGRVFTY